MRRPQLLYCAPVDKYQIVPVHRFKLRWTYRALLLQSGLAMIHPTPQETG